MDEKYTEMKTAHIGSPLESTRWEENIILADATWMDDFVFDVTVNFERMLERPLPKASIDRWTDFLSLDGGLRPGNNKTQVILLHQAERHQLNNWIPADITNELDGMAFKDNLGEFSFFTLPVEEDLVDAGNMYAQCMEALLSSPKVKRLMLVPRLDHYGHLVKTYMNNIQWDGKDVTLFTTEPVAGFKCRQEILSYSIMATLGIEAKELKQE